MKVKKSTKSVEPRYPSARQFAEYKKMFGVAAIGLSALTVGADAPRTLGVPMPPKGRSSVEPTNATPSACTTNAPSPASKNVRLRGDIAVEPVALPGEMPVMPSSATNRATKATTNQPPIKAEPQSGATGSK